MKNKILTLAIAAFTVFAGTAKAQFIDLSTGKQVTVIKHNANGMMFNTATQKPVYIYINPATNDTFYGRTGANINGRVARTPQGKFIFDDGDYIFDNGEYRMKRESDSSGYKVKWQNDGDKKVKTDDYKRKTDKNGDLKLKQDSSKIKVYSDGRLKVKEGEYRKKIDGEGNYREGDGSVKVKSNVDGSTKIKDKKNNYKAKVNEEQELKEKQNGTKRKVKKNKVKVKTDD